MKSFLISALLMSLCAHANLDKAPQSFKHEQTKAVFVDFINAHYSIEFNVESRTTTVNSIIEFNQDQEGMPIFDLRNEIAQISVDGDQITVGTVEDPDRQTYYRLAKKVLAPGKHLLTMKHTFDRNTKYSYDSVAAGFWMSDLSDRKYIEQYLPANLEYDQYKMVFDVKITGTEEKHEVFTNGAIAEIAKNQFAISFPEYFTASSVYFHLTKEGRLKRKDFSYTSINGAIIPIVAYSASSWNMFNIDSKILEILEELEENFGAWGHPSLTVYVAGSGGMEHSGATITSLSALGHELIHSYFARGVMPIDGNSGWLDEAIASWRDGGYDSSSKPFYRSTRMSGFSQYKRTTTRKAYSEGESFMEYLNHKLSGVGGLRSFLSKLYSNYLHQSISTETFKKELEAFSGIDFEQDFLTYVFDGNKKSHHGHSHEDSSSTRENPYHPRLSEKQLRDLL